MFKSKKLKISLILLSAFYLSGIIGIVSKTKAIDFLSLTPLNLMISALILFVNHQNGEKKQWFIFFNIALLGFFIEAIGVNTGVIFGEYEYQTTLGKKVFGTPLIIGINWIILTYSVVYTLSTRMKNKVVLAFVSAIVLVLLDFLIEPVAIKYHFWSWNHTTVPLKNYAAWFIISVLFCYTIAHFKEKSFNKIAPVLLIFQFIFFGILNFLI